MKTAITIDGHPVHIPATWSEISFGQFIAMKAATTDPETLAVLTGLSLQVCEQVPPNVAAIIMRPATEMGELALTDSPVIMGKPVPVSIGSMEFARKVNCDAMPKLYADEALVARLVAIYCAEGIEDEDIERAYLGIMKEPFIEVASAGKVISDQLLAMQKAEESIKAPEYESEEYLAGIGDFKKYGVFGLVRGIALRFHCTKDDVYKWSYNSVILELRYSADESAYARKLNKALSRKK